jgi:putative oxidoreductase
MIIFLIKKKGGMVMLKKLLYSEDRISQGLLVLRVGIGIAFIVHGFPKLFMGGAVHLAEALTKTGIPGGIIGAYLAGSAEFFGGIALIAGILFLPTTLIMAFNMFVAVAFLLSGGAAFKDYSHALESLILFIALAVTGPGRYSLDYRLYCWWTEERKPTKKFAHSVLDPV